jgi:hypothetical protein
LECESHACKEFNMARPDLVDALVLDLEPVRPAAPWLSAMFSWCLVSWAIVGGTILASGPLRDGIVVQLMSSPRFALELALGFAAGLAAIWAGLELGVPGAPASRRLWTPPILLFGAWTLVVGYGLIQPSDPPMMDGKRVHCFMQTLLISLPPYTTALYLLRGRITYAQTRAGLLVGTAAAAIPALWMHVACHTEPLHVLMFHLSPILIVGLLGAIVAHRVLPHV